VIYPQCLSARLQLYGLCILSSFFFLPSSFIYSQCPPPVASFPKVFVGIPPPHSPMPPVAPPVAPPMPPRACQVRV
jgi:hypothetical protein